MGNFLGRMPEEPRQLPERFYVTLRTYWSALELVESS